MDDVGWNFAIADLFEEYKSALIFVPEDADISELSELVR
jgi:hypothetical protein